MAGVAAEGDRLSWVSITLWVLMLLLLLLVRVFLLLFGFSVCVWGGGGFVSFGCVCMFVCFFSFVILLNCSYPNP